MTTARKIRTAVAGALLAALAAVAFTAGTQHQDTDVVADPNWGLVSPTPTVLAEPAPVPAAPQDPNWDVAPAEADPNWG
ncbi:hypothetical protein [Streptomyces filamentosus]|uniref:hypothetical protein n=1 Tax=Streptomyces filamentosus TaxID=67294 RepID=UPI0033F9FF45